MNPVSTRTIPADAGTFEPFGDFQVNLRQLALHIAEIHRQPDDRAWPFTDQGPISAEERTALSELAFDHLLRHDLGTTPAEKPCVFPARSCKALGGAQVVISLLYAFGDKLNAELPMRLRRDVSALESALDRFLSDLGIYLGTRAAIHKASLDTGDDGQKVRPICGGKAHTLFCTYPMRLAKHAERLAALLPLFEAVSLVPQIPDYLRGEAHRGLLVSLELTLARCDWKPDEILATLHDGLKPKGKDNYRKRKSRLNLRLKYHKSKTEQASRADSP